MSNTHPKAIRAEAAAAARRAELNAAKEHHRTLCAHYRPSFIVTGQRMVIAYTMTGRNIVKVATALAHPKDPFNVAAGKRLALMNLHAGEYITMRIPPKDNVFKSPRAFLMYVFAPTAIYSNEPDMKPDPRALELRDKHVALIAETAQRAALDKELDKALNGLGDVLNQLEAKLKSDAAFETGPKDEGSVKDNIQVTVMDDGTHHITGAIEASSPEEARKKIEEFLRSQGFTGPINALNIGMSDTSQEEADRRAAEARERSRPRLDPNRGILRFLRTAGEKDDDAGQPV